MSPLFLLINIKNMPQNISFFTFCDTLFIILPYLCTQIKTNERIRLIKE